jgi:hypothetical protein
MEVNLSPDLEAKLAHCEPADPTTHVSVVYNIRRDPCDTAMAGLVGVGSRVDRSPPEAHGGSRGQRSRPASDAGALERSSSRSSKGGSSSRLGTPVSPGKSLWNRMKYLNPSRSSRRILWSSHERALSGSHVSAWPTDCRVLLPAARSEPAECLKPSGRARASDRFRRRRAGHRHRDHDAH